MDLSPLMLTLLSSSKLRWVRMYLKAQVITKQQTKKRSQTTSTKFFQLPSK